MGELIGAGFVPSIETIPAVIADIVSVPAYCGDGCLCIQFGSKPACQPAFDLLSPDEARSLHIEHARTGDPVVWLMMAEHHLRPAALAGIAGVVCVPMTVIRRSLLPHYLAAHTMEDARQMLPPWVEHLTTPYFTSPPGAPEVWF